MREYRGELKKLAEVMGENLLRRRPPRALLRHQGQPLPAVPAPGPRHGPARAHRRRRRGPAVPGRPGRRPRGAQGRRVDRRRRPHRRPDRGAQVMQRVAPRPARARRQPLIRRLVLQPVPRRHHHAGHLDRRRGRGVPRVRVRGLHGRVRQAKEPRFEAVRAPKSSPAPAA
jgi:hypothetical protein